MDNAAQVAVSPLGRNLALDQPLYDTINLAVGATAGTFFQVPFGGAIGAGVKDFSHTNLQLASQLEAGKSFTCDSLGLYIRETAVPASEVNIRSFQSGALILTVSNVEFLKVPLALIPSGGAELVLFSNIAAAATEFQLDRGVSHSSNRYILRRPIEIPSTTQFSVAVSNFTAMAAAAMQVTLVLFGVESRIVR